jgi:hypothetical protein
LNANGDYAVRYSPKQSETWFYTIESWIAGFPKESGQFVVGNKWPGKPRKTDFLLGNHWYTDRHDPKFYDGKIQGGLTVNRWRNEVLQDWAKRWQWLRTTDERDRQ